MQIENGRWGPFVRFGKQNLKIPKGTDVSTITYADVLKWAEEDPKVSKAKATKTTAKATTKKPAAKKTTTKKATTKSATKKSK